MDNRKFIVTIGDVVDCGVGFFVGNYLITAGHVVDEKKDMFIHFDGRKYTLNAKDAIVFESWTDDMPWYDGDVSVFKFEGINSPLRLAQELPTQTSNLVCESFIPKVVNQAPINPHGTDIFSKPISSMYMEPVASTAKIVNTEYENNLFICEMSPILYKGASGSPLMDGNTVYGLLYAGADKYCGFVTAKYIADKITNIS